MFFLDCLNYVSSHNPLIIFISVSLKLILIFFLNNFQLQIFPIHLFQQLY